MPPHLWDKNPVRALLKNERRLGVPNLATLHRFPFLPTKQASTEKSYSERLGFQGSDHLSTDFHFEWGPDWTQVM
jgi:hypothetical protein